MTRLPARLALAPCAFAGLLFAAPLGAQERVEVGNAASVAGEVTLDNARLRRPIAVERRQRIAWGDLIETKRNSQLQILLLDRSNFGIGQRSRVRIDRYVYDPAAGRSVFASFLKGALRFFSGAGEGENTAQVATPAGRIGIRGTAIDMLVGEVAEAIAEDEPAIGNVASDRDEATLVVLRGPGAGALAGVAPGLADVTGADVTVTLDAPGLAAYIPRNGAAPIGPFRISTPGLARVQNEIAPRWANSFGGGGIPDEVIVGAAAAAVLGIILGTRGGDDDEDRPDRTTQGDRQQGSPNRSPNSSQRQPAPTQTPPQQRRCYDANGTEIPCSRIN